MEKIKHMMKMNDEFDALLSKYGMIDCAPRIMYITHEDQKLTRKQAIDSFIDMCVIANELMAEIEELKAICSNRYDQITSLKNQMREIEIRHEGFVAGLTHGFKIESGDV